LRELVPHHPAMKAFPEVPTLWDVDERLRMMDEFDGLQQVLSLANPPIEQLGGPELTPQVARIANDGLAELVSRHPRRFPGFIASMPANNVEACLEEIDRSIGILGARGIQLFHQRARQAALAPRVPPDLPPHGRARPAGVDPPDPRPQQRRLRHEKMSENEIWFTFGWPYENHRVR
jgi:predicted TIM-barrel fold metal-dependent hydrolase